MKEDQFWRCFRMQFTQDVLSDLDSFGFPREYAVPRERALMALDASLEVRCLQLNKHNHVTTTWPLKGKAWRALGGTICCRKRSAA